MSILHVVQEQSLSLREFPGVTLWTISSFSVQPKHLPDLANPLHREGRILEVNALSANLCLHFAANKNATERICSLSCENHSNKAGGIQVLRTHSVLSKLTQL